MDTRHTFWDGGNKNVPIGAVGHENNKNRHSKYYPDVSVVVSVKPFTIPTKP